MYILPTKEELEFVKGLSEVMQDDYYSNIDEADAILEYIRRVLPQANVIESVCEKCGKQKSELSEITGWCYKCLLEEL